MPTSLGRILFSIGPLWMGLIRALLSLTGSRHSLAMPFVMGTNKKQQHHLDVSSMPIATNFCCPYYLSSSSFWSSCNAYATLLGMFDMVDCHL